MLIDIYMKVAMNWTRRGLDDFRHALVGVFDDITHFCERIYGFSSDAS